VRGRNYDIEVVDPDGRHRVRLTSDTTYDGALAWSPDGRRIAFISDRAGYSAVFLISPDGSGAVRLTAGPSLTPSWSR